MIYIYTCREQLPFAIMVKRGAEDANLSQNKEEAKDSKASKLETSPNSKLVNVSLKLRKATSTMSQKMGEIYVAQTETVDALNFQGCFIESVNSKLVDLEKRDMERKKEINAPSSELRSTKEKLSAVNKKVTRTQKN